MLKINHKIEKNQTQLMYFYIITMNTVIIFHPHFVIAHLIFKGMYV